MSYPEVWARVTVLIDQLVADIDCREARAELVGLLDEYYWWSDFGASLRMAFSLTSRDPSEEGLISYDELAIELASARRRWPHESDIRAE